MPLYDYLCSNCGELSEILIVNTSEQVQCQNCGSTNLKKMLSAPSSLSGILPHRAAGAGDTACCGSSPGQSGCAGPGSCCGKMPR